MQEIPLVAAQQPAFHPPRFCEIKPVIDLALTTVRQPGFLTTQQPSGEMHELFEALESWFHRPFGQDIKQELASSGKLDRLHNFVSRYEYLREMELATALLKSSNPGQGLVKLVEDEAWWAATPNLMTAFGEQGSVLVAGSGPLPFTACCLAMQGRRVICVEKSRLAFDTSSALLSASPFADKIELVQGDALTAEIISEVDVVFAALLLGVGHSAQDRTTRQQITKRLFDRLAVGQVMVTRSPIHSGWLMYPQLELTDFVDHRVALLEPDLASLENMLFSAIRIEKTAQRGGL